MKLKLFKEESFLQSIKNIYSSNKYLIISAAILFVIIYVGVSPVYKINEYKKLVKSDSLYILQYDSIYNNPDLDSLVREKSYKQALLKLSEQDSIQLIVNLQDSIVCLSIKGVIIHETSINNFKINPLLHKLHGMEYVKLFSQPLEILSQEATIVKEPIVVRHAPKDTAEAALNAYEPDTLIQKPAFLKLKIDHGIQILFEQELNPTFKHKWVRFIFKTKIKTKAVFKGIKHFLSFKAAEYNPTIIIKMPADDLRAIYRALPNESYVVLKYNSN